MLIYCHLLLFTVMRFDRKLCPPSGPADFETRPATPIAGRRKFPFLISLGGPVAGYPGY
jgi:hypothetical protein